MSFIWPKFYSMCVLNILSTKAFGPWLLVLFCYSSVHCWRRLGESVVLCNVNVKGRQDVSQAVCSAGLNWCVVSPVYNILIVSVVGSIGILYILVEAGVGWGVNEAQIETDLVPPKMSIVHKDSKDIFELLDVFSCHHREVKTNYIWSI